jgi:hypothetical protein
MSVISILADYRSEDAKDYTVDLIPVNGDIYHFINTPGHGYLAIGSDENGYSDACEIARASNYSFILDGGIVYLEEDVDAPKLLEILARG